MDWQFSHGWLRARAEELLRAEGKERNILAWSEEVRMRQIRLLGHIIRADPRDPMRRVTFQDGVLQPNIPGARRVGRPRKPWLLAVKEVVWQRISEHPFGSTVEENHQIEDRALLLEPPFG